MSNIKTADFEKNCIIKKTESKRYYEPKTDIDKSELEEFYEFALLDAAKEAAKNNAALEMEIANGDIFKAFLERNESKNKIGSLLVEKIYQGKDKFFQMAYLYDKKEMLLTFKRSLNPKCCGYSAIISPRKRVIINGYGTIGKKVCDLAKKCGFEIIGVTNSGYMDDEGQAKHITYDAIYKGYPLYLIPSSKTSVEALQKAGISYNGTLISLLEKMRKEGKKVIIIDASTGGKDAPETRSGCINNEKIYKPYSDVIEARLFQGGESPEFVAEGRAFSTETSDFETLKGKVSAEIVSCNTTGLNRIFKAVSDAVTENSLSGNIIIDNIALRREMDPGEDKIGLGDHVQIESCHPKLSKELNDYLSKPINIDCVYTSEKGVYVHMVTVRGISDIEEMRKVILSAPHTGFFLHELSEKKMESAYIHQLIEEKGKYIIAFKVLKSDLPNEVKVVFGYSMNMPHNDGEDLSVLGIKKLISLLKQNNKVSAINDTIYIPSYDITSTKGGITQTSTHHTAKDLKMTLTQDQISLLSGVNTPAAKIPGTHFHVHIARVKADGLTIDMLRKSFKKQQRIALVHFPRNKFSSSVLFEVLNSSIGEEVKGGSHSMIAVAQLSSSQIPGEIKIVYAVPQESIVIPENINALHALLGIFPKDRSREIVNEVAGIDRIKQGIEARLPDFKAR